MNFKILKRPVITEKAAALGELSTPQYVFQVELKANKIEIARAVEAMFPGVRVATVRTATTEGKTKRQYSRRGARAGKKSDQKKAVVTLREGTINLYGDEPTDEA